MPYRCLKCQNSDYESAQMRATGGILSKIFDIQTRRFTTVTCTRCSYTELYRADSSRLGDIFDFFTQ